MTCDGCDAELTAVDLAARGPARAGRHPDVLAAAAAIRWVWCADCIEGAWFLLSLDVARRGAGLTWRRADDDGPDMRAA